MKTFLSKYIKKSAMNKSAVEALENDIAAYNKILHKMVNDSWRAIPSEYKDLSRHMRYVKEFKLSHYMATSLTRVASGILDAGLEALDRDIQAKEHKLKQMNAKVESLQKKYNIMFAMKTSLKERSLARKNGTPIPKFKNRWGKLIIVKVQKDGRMIVTVDTGNLSSRKKKKPPLVFDNEYLFETQFVDPYLRSKRARIGQIKGRIHNTETRLEALKRRKEEKHPSICFGGKQLSRQRQTLWEQQVAKPCAADRRSHVSKKVRTKSTQRKLGRKEAIANHMKRKPAHMQAIRKDWQCKYAKARLHEMVLVGRADLTNGNAVIRYNTETRALTYNIKDFGPVILPHVVFPYGQEFIDQAVAAHRIAVQNKNLPEEQKTPGWEPGPVTWSIKDCGNAFLVKCMVSIPDNKYMNSDFSDGVIAFDMNYDHLAVMNIDKHGGRVSYRVLNFRVTTKSGGQNENAISNALEEVFRWAKAENKPIVMEDIDEIQQSPMYGSKKRNRKISQFAYSKMAELAESKSQRYGICVRKVNPMFTSQIGKLKYMKNLRVSVHCAAAYVIGRRGMDFDEPVPKTMWHLVPEAKLHENGLPKWAGLAKTLKNIRPHVFYSKIDYSSYKTLPLLKKALTKL